MNVFILGGTGAVGWHAVRALRQHGHTVTALARSPEKAAKLTALGVLPVSLSMFDRAAMTAAFQGYNAIINLATSIPPTSKFMQPDAWSANTRIRTEGSAAVVDAALAAGVPRVVQESVCMIYPDAGAAWVSEEAIPDRFPMALPNLAAEANAQRFTGQGRIGVILRFGWFYGPGATHSEEFLRLARWGVCIQMGAPNGYVSSIHMADAGTATEAALRAPAGIYNIVDNEPLMKKHFAAAIAAAAGRSWYLRLPGRTALLLGDRSTSLTRSLRVSNQRFRTATGWEPQFPSAREGWAAMTIT